MPGTIADIREGMEVYGSDSQKIGTVMRVSPGGTDAGASRPPEMDDPAAVEPTSVPPIDPSLGDGSALMGRGGIGRVPLGATSEKDRGEASLSGIAGSRGDVPARSNDLGATPGAIGMDALRGAGPPPHDAGQMAGAAGATLPTGGMAGAAAGAVGVEEVMPPDVGGSSAAPQQFAGDAGSGGAASALPDVTPGGGQQAVGGGRTLGHLIVQDPGVLGVGARGLRVPLDAVQEVSGGRVTLAVTKLEAVNRFGPGPSLDIDENAPVVPF